MFYNLNSIWSQDVYFTKLLKQILEQDGFKYLHHKVSHLNAL
jgi:hypothetical protein